MKIKRTTKLVLKPSEKEKQILFKTLEEYKFAYNFVAETVWKYNISNSVKLHNHNLTYIKGRLKLKIKIPEYVRQYLDWDIRSASLKYDKRLKKFFFNIVIEKEIEEIPENDTVVGVDLGHLKKLSQKEKRFRTAVNHKIAKEIVSLVSAGGTIVLENLKGIRERVKVSKKERR